MLIPQFSVVIIDRIFFITLQVEINASKSAVGPQSLCNALKTMNGRLSHLYLAHNRLAGIPQIITILAVSKDVVSETLSMYLMHNLGTSQTDQSVKRHLTISFSST